MEAQCQALTFDTVFNLPPLTDRIKASPFIINGNTIAIPPQVILTFHTVLSDPVKVFEKKLHLLLGWWSFCESGFM